ncbi:MAG: hypoxanthine phosphoribosyltransferase [Acidobacteriota bacterium]|nr:MAG: hypoxanthine phosphoribosyltransferase [Acidobacteriota bacterium]
MPGPELEVLLSEEAILDRVTELATQISDDYKAEGVEDVYMLGVLRGAFIFLADLSRRLTIPRRVDFIALSSYDDASTTSGAVRLVLDVRAPLRGKHVLVVEDIVDSGKTLEYLLRTLNAREPASLKTCVLLQKPDRLEVPVSVDYLGFTIPDKWVVGYGLDYTDQYRTLPYIGVVQPSG